MKKLRILAILAVAVAVFSSCEEKDEKPSKTGLITGKFWILEAATVDPGLPLNGTIVTNLYPQLPTCYKDNTMKLEKNGTTTFEEGASKCQLSDDQTTLGTWVFNTDETVVTIKDDEETISYKILDLTANSLKVEYEDEDENGFVYTVTATYRVAK